jgi:hypothetical protein
MNSLLGSVNWLVEFHHHIVPNRSPNHETNC